LDAVLARQPRDEADSVLPVALSQSAGLRLLERTIFGGLLVLLALTAIPYGTVEPWSEALFECGVWLLTLLWIVHGLFAGSWSFGNARLFYPLIALVAFALLQSIALWQTTAAGEKVWYAISADPFETRRFVLKVAALILAGMLLTRYTTSKKRLSALVHLMIAIAMASAMFGIVRQSVQHSDGFFLPALRVGAGYAQFINRNHFSFLMEMAMGLVAGLMVVRSRKRERLPLYAAALLALWTALVLANSRGGLLAMIVQLICAVILFPIARQSYVHERTGDAQGIFRFARSFAGRAAMLTVVVAVVVAGVIWIGGDPLAATLENTSVEVGPADKSVMYERVRRRDIWYATSLMIKAHPLAGAGFGGYWAEIPQYHDASGLFTPQQAHNDYLEILASGGLIGFGLLVWFATMLFKQTRKALASADPFYNAVCFGAIIGLAGVAVHSIFDFGLHITLNALVFVALLAILSLKPTKAKLAASEYAARGSR
jgi:O-antigen ligase